MRHKKRALGQSLILLLLCFSMLVGTTFAWFTDGVSSGINTIAAGVLDVELYHSNANVREEKVTAGTEMFLDLNGDAILWEPGVVSYENLRVVNEGGLALAYQLSIATANENHIVDPSGAVYGLSQILKVGVVKGGITATNREGVVASVAEADWVTLADFLRNGSLLPEDEESWGVVVWWEPGENDNLWNLNNGKKLDEGDTLKIDLGINLIATQESYEADSFGSDYDADAKADVFPEFVGGSASAPVMPDGNNCTSEPLTMSSGDVTASVPAGVQLAAGTTELTLTVTELETSGANINLDPGEAMRSLDVHIEGVDSANTLPITVTLKEVAPKGLNMGNYKLYHVENGTTNEMTLIGSGEAFTAHNQFKYDPATGDVVLYMASFSEVAMTAEAAKWEGEFDHSWYDASKTELIIANADQLWSFSQIVGGMAKDADGNVIAQNSFFGKTVKLIADVDLDDGEASNASDRIFYPIGYYNSEGTYERTNTAITSGLRNFEGTFDGNGHTIANFYHNTWEMKGDHDWYSPEEQYYRDGMGLFGRVYGGTVKNLTVKNFSSDGEIATTGVIAAYADGATFENIAIFNCNPRVYNIGNGGIVGCVGWYAKEGNLKTTFKNITVDNSNKISALWGSYDVACGGIVGQYYPTSGQTSAGTPKNGGVHFENCHVSAQLDVYNDVCGNYMYYAYRYAGMMIGSIRENETIDGRVYPKMDGITASGCTVNYGDWNDYYYCEFEKNGHPSYAQPDEYKFSRVPESELVRDSEGKVTGCIHDHSDVEDNRAIYLPFDQLFTGYGWGVTSKGIKDFEGIDTIKVDYGTQEESVVKFERNPAFTDESVITTIVRVGDLFAEVVNPEVAVNDSAVQVAVTGINGSGITAEYSASNTGNWEDGTLTFNKIEGLCSVTIQDYEFCKPTSFVLKDGKLYKTEKFDKLFTGDFLYRVGNVNEVALSTLFVEKNGTPVGKVTVTVENVSGNAAGDLTAKDAWKDSTIKFSGNGLVKVTIKDEDIAGVPTELMLEVVDAYNTLSAVSAPYEYGGEKHNVVLLKEGTSSNGFTVKDGYAFYGNGFTVTCSGKGTYLNNGGMTLGYASVQTGGILDNVKIICDIYPNAFVYSEEVKVSSNLDKDASTSDKTRYMYQLSAISVSGDGSVVANCYAYGGRNNIFVGGGDVLVENTVTECGTLSNIQIKASSDDTVILKDVTTIQYQTKSTYDTTKTMLGFGVVVGDNESESNANIVLQGDFKQYNWVTSADENVSNTYAKTAISGALAVKDYQHTINGQVAVNMGIAYLNNRTTSFPSENDQRINKNTIPYIMREVTMSGKTGYVYSISGSTINGENRYDANTDGITPDQSDAQKDIAPKPVFSLGNQAVNGEDRYLQGDMNGITARYENGQEPLTLDITKLMTASKYGSACAVNATCIDPDGKELSGTVTLNKTGVYTLKFTIVDDLFYTETGEKIEGKQLSYTYSVKVTLTIAEPSVPDATLTVDTSKTYQGKYTDSTSDGSKKMSFNPLEPIVVTDAGTNFDLKSNVKSTDISYTAFGTDGNGNAFSGNTTITVTYNEGQVLTIVFVNVNSNSPGNPKSITYDSSTGTVKSSNTLAKNSCTAASWAVTSYSFTGKNGKTVTSAGVTFNIPKDTSGGCFTPDTLVTLADGTQKEIQYLSADDMLLVWDFYKGEYTVVPSAAIVNHGKQEYIRMDMRFDDGTEIHMLQNHEFFSVDLNKWVYIDETNIADYVGMAFAKKDGNGFTTVKLVDYSISREVTEAYCIVTALHYNCFAENLLTLTPSMFGSVNYYTPFAIGEGMKYDEAKMQADIAKYGLYTYEDFAEHITFEQFAGFNAAYLKVSVGKGLVTYEQLIESVYAYINP